MNKKLIRAIEISIQVWSELRDNPDITRKSNLSDKTWNKIKKMENNCPLCDYYSGPENGCNQCCLCGEIGTICANGYYEDWFYAPTNNQRAEFCNKILDMLFLGLDKEKKII